MRKPSFLLSFYAVYEASQLLDGGHQVLLGLRLDVWVEDVLHLQFGVCKANGIDVLFGEFYLHGRGWLMLPAQTTLPCCV